MKFDLAVAGIGMVRPATGETCSARELRRLALDAALTDAQVQRAELNGYISMMEQEDLRYLGLAPDFSVQVISGGASVGLSLLTAGAALATGQADFVALTLAMAPTAGKIRTGTYSYGYAQLYGMFGPVASHALHATRHAALYGTTSEDLGAVAVAQSQYAQRRPEAVGYGHSISLADHQASRPVVDPLRVLDCCRDIDVAVAVIVTTRERVRRPGGLVRIAGIGLAHNIANWFNGSVYEQHDNVAPALRKALSMAELELGDVDIAQLYDPYTISVLMQLEHYGFCKPGEAAAFVASGETGPGGALPTNTGGGQLSGWYATGFTPLFEAIHQLRGTADAGQLPGVEVALVSGHGGNAGVQNTWAHATMLMVRDR